MGRRHKLPYELGNYSAASHRGAHWPYPPITLKVSDKAWAHHRELAVQYGYIKAAATKSMGIVAWFYHLAHPAQVWVDCRPAYLVELSERLLNPEFDAQRRKGAERTPTFLFDPSLPLAVNPHPISGRMAPRASDRAPGPRHPVWWDPDEDIRRTQRLVQGGPEGFPVRYYADLALRFGIGDPRQKVFPIDKPRVLASCALEAIGHGMLVATLIYNNPTPPKHPHVRKYKKGDFDW